MLSILDGGPLSPNVWVPRSVREILTRAAETNSGRIVFDGRTITSRDLLREAEHFAHDVERDGVPVLRVTDAASFLPRLWSCFLGGAIPVVAAENVELPPLPEIPPGTALLMRTSGTTGEPKVVALSHENVIASIAASVLVNGITVEDVSLNWLPLHHIGGLMRSIRELYARCTQIQVPTAIVGRDPLRWLDLVDEHRATLTWAPNSAFAAVVAQRHEIPSRGHWKLDSMRLLHSSGEVVASSTVRRFLELLEPFGLAASTFRSSWGMTEACFATNSDSLSDSGTPVPGISLRVVGPDGEMLPEGETGHLQICGPLVASAGWMETGDAAQISGGRLTINGRFKDMIKVGGVAYSSRRLEEIVESIDGITTAAACGVMESEGEAVAIFADVAESAVPEVRRRIAEELGIAPRFVVPLATQSYPRTDTGKVSRHELRERFASGAFDEFRRWPWDLRTRPAALPASASDVVRQRAEELARVIGDVLHTTVGVDDDFFERGGTSLRVAQAAARIGCSLVDLFSAPTPRLLAGRLTRTRVREEARITERDDAIAIVGIAGRFPGARNVDEFWRMLAEGREALTEFSERELLDSGIDPQTIANPSYVRNGMILEDVESFDAKFFGISPADAESMDPQQRLLLETAWHAMEDAGLVPGRLKTGVWIGARLSDYLIFNLPAPDIFGQTGLPAEGFRRILLNDKDYLATRIAHALDCRGPAISIQTACSSSLVAAHLAAKSLLNRECDAAIAGGASVRVPHRAGYLYTEGMIYSPDGRTRPFDEAASGTQFGSGVGIIVLRRLSEALRDGDRIYAVIRGSAVNNDGSGPKAGFTSPSHDGQAAVIADAIANAGVDPATISYVEAHGTGTAVGDPIEIAALTDCFRTAQKGSCAVGSVKSNIGHLVQAGGVAGLIKTALMLRNRTLVPTVNFREPNPLIDFDSSPFYVNTETREWSRSAEPLRAGVSAFGFGGTNAHVILEEAPARLTTEEKPETARILPVSAASPDALRDLSRTFAQSDAPLRDLCASAQNCRSHLPYRIAVVASSREELREKLASAAIPTSVPRKPRIAFVFGGQGTQYRDMGRQLYETTPLFRRFVDDNALAGTIFHGEIESTEFAQPALVALQAGLIQVWRSWGIHPDVVVGHSLGEITAAWAAGVLSLQDAMQFATARGRLMEATQSGRMAIVFTPPEQIESRNYDVAIAAVNAPHQTVISGTEAAVDAVLAEMRLRGIATRKMSGRYAFHSPLMEPILAKLEMEASHLTTAEPTLPVISTLTGCETDTSFASPDYWRRQARERVQFHRALENSNADVLVQIAPGHDTREAMLTKLAELYGSGADVAWSLVEEESWNRVPLPAYPFQRKRYWVTPSPRTAPRPAGGHPLLGSRVASPLPDVQFASELTADVAPFARDHWIYGTRPLVMVGQLEMMRAAAGFPAVAVENVIVEQPLLLSDAPRRVSTVMSPDGVVRIHSSGDGTSWELHSSAKVTAVASGMHYVDLEAIRTRCPEEIPGARVYDRKKQKGAQIESGMELVQRVWRRDGEVLAEVALDAEARAFAGAYVAYPGLLDSFAQCGELTLTDIPGDDHSKYLYLPTVVNRATFSGVLPERVFTTLRRRTDATGDVYGVDGEITDAEGRVLVSIEGFYFKRATAAALMRGDVSHEIDWVPLEEPEVDVEEGSTLIASAGLSAAALCDGALALARKMIDANDSGPLWIVTRGGQATGRETAPLAPDQAALWGFGRSLQREQPQLRCRLIDLDPATEGVSDLRRAMSRSGNAHEIAIRSGALLARRIVRQKEASRSDGVYALVKGRARTVEELSVAAAERREPGDNEIEIEIYCTGLNFRDVLNATGRIEGPLGYECSGVVTRCGANVEGLEPGDAVMALALSSFASHLTIDARFAVKKPRNLGFAAAAAAPVAYVTATYALRDQAQLRAGERVLVHTAAGGVGHAAVHVARALGAEVVATASRSKWPLVRAMGVREVFDSRAAGFGESVRKVDVVLNTLGNDFADQNVRVLRSGGRLIELGHTAVLDVQREEQLSAAAGVKFVNFHIAQDVDPDEIHRMLTELRDDLESGRLPALPVQTYPLSDVRHAFESMLRGSHVGKIAVTHPALGKAELTADADSTYLVTGGTGAVGTRIAEWLVERGARHLAILSRRAEQKPIRDAEVRMFACDVADEEALRRVIDEIAATMPPLRGIVHAAGILDDGIVTKQTPERLRAVLAPKVGGAWNLHRLTASLPLDFFVLVSSVSGVWGNGGQTSYAAANAFLDQFAQWRRQRGLPATSIDYGAWSGGGMASTLPDAARRRREESGAGDLHPDAAVKALERALAADRAQVAVFAGAAPLVRERTQTETTRNEGAPPRSLADAVDRTRRKVAELCGVAKVDVDQPLSESGLDSLSVLLLRGRLIAEFGDAAALPVIRFLEGRSVSELASMMCERVAPAPPRPCWTSLTPLKPKGSRPPLFLVPPAIRTASFFAPLASLLDGDRPVYALNPVGLDGLAAPHDSVEAAAEHYLEEIRSACPSGPYIVGGACFGGIVAWEMAVRLRREGADVPLVILIDPAAPGPAQGSPGELLGDAILRGVGRVRDHLKAFSLYLRQRRVHDWISARLRNEPFEVEAQLHRAVRAHAAAFKNYRAPELDAAVLLVQSAEFQAHGPRWQRLARGAFEAVRLPVARHVDALDEARTAEVTKIISERMAVIR